MLGDTWSGITGLVSAVGVIVVAVLQYKSRALTREIKATTENVATAVATSNGHTLGEVTEAIHDEVVPNGMADHE